MSGLAVLVSDPKFYIGVLIVGLFLIYKHATQPQTLTLRVENQTGAELECGVHHIQYGARAVFPADLLRVSPEQEQRWEFTKGTFARGFLAMWYGMNGLMRYTLGNQTLLIAWNVPDPWGASFPWFKEYHLNNFDVKLVPTADLGSRTTRDIAEEHALGTNGSLWRVNGEPKQQDLNVYSRIDFGRGCWVRAFMSADWRRSELHVIVCSSVIPLP